MGGMGTKGEGIRVLGLYYKMQHSEGLKQQKFILS